MKWYGWIITHVLIAVLGGVLVYFLIPKEVIKIVNKTEVQYEKIYIPYEKKTTRELVDRLICYDQGKPTLDGVMDGNIMRLNAGLCERVWTRDIELASYSKGNWRITAGVGAASLVVGLVVGGGAMYKILKK